MKRGVRYLLVICLIIFLLGMAGCSQQAKIGKTSNSIATAKPVILTISAAASLTEVMGELKTLYINEKPNVTINYNFGSSGALEQQIEQGAGADLFLSAATKQMDVLQKKGLILDETKINLLGNIIVLIVKSDSTLDVNDFKDLVSNKIKKVALGEPKTVSVGQYSEDIFTSLSMLDKIRLKAVYGNDVKEALAWVEAGNADVGVVYGTDAKASKKVKVVAVAGKELYKTQVVYPVAIIKASKNIEDTKAFLKYLSSTKAKEVFVKYGFDFLIK